MYASFDRSSPVKLDTTVHSLSWKGNAKQGWLALGNSAKTVGVTYTEVSEESDLPSGSDAHPELALDRQGMRRNFNFREHSHEVSERVPGGKHSGAMTFMSGFGSHES